MPLCPERLTDFLLVASSSLGIPLLKLHIWEIPDISVHLCIPGVQHNGSLLASTEFMLHIQTQPITVPVLSTNIWGMNDKQMNDQIEPDSRLICISASSNSPEPSSYLIVFLFCLVITSIKFCCIKQLTMMLWLMMIDATKVILPRECESTLLPVSYHLGTWVNYWKTKGTSHEQQL